jgi:hypothetical protein
VESHDRAADEGVRVERVSDGEEKLGTNMDIHLIGFDPTTRLGGPIEIVEGRIRPALER